MNKTARMHMITRSHASAKKKEKKQHGLFDTTHDHSHVFLESVFPDYINIEKNKILGRSAPHRTPSEPGLLFLLQQRVPHPGDRRGPILPPRPLQLRYLQGGQEEEGRVRG